MKITYRTHRVELERSLFRGWAQSGVDEFLGALEDRNFSPVRSWSDQMFRDFIVLTDALRLLKEDYEGGVRDLVDLFNNFPWCLPNWFLRCKHEREIIIDCIGVEVVINEEQIAKIEFFS